MFGLMGVARMSGQQRAFSPLSLFASGEQGVWYDPSDFSSMFQDSGGTTPVTAVGQPVGLILDKRLGLVRGAELVPNNDFSGGTYDAGGGRTLPNNWGMYTGGNVSAASVVGGIFAFTGTAHLAGITANTSLTASTSLAWKVRARKTAQVSGTPSLNVLTASGWLTVVPTGAAIGEWVELSAVTPGGVTNYEVSNFNGAASWEVDYVSIKELPGNHALQATAAARPVVSAPSYINYDGIDDLLATTFPNLGTNVTIARAVPGVGASILTGQTIGAGVRNDSTNHAGLVIIDRALTAGETAALTAYLNAKAGV